MVAGRTNDRVQLHSGYGEGRFSEESCVRIQRRNYARRTITRRPILPIDNANAICFLAGEQSAKTTGHIIPVDGGLPV